LQADVHQAEFGIKEVVVKDALWPTCKGQVWPTLAVKEFDGATSFLDAEDGDQAVITPLLAKDLPDQFLLAMEALQVMVRSPGLFRFVFGMVDQRLGLPLNPRQEVLAADLEAMIDPAVQVIVAAKGEIALENHPIMAAENGYNRSSEFPREVEVRRHGVLLPGVFPTLD
jgi:hypothetical protein